MITVYSTHFCVQFALYLNRKPTPRLNKRGTKKPALIPYLVLFVFNRMNNLSDPPIAVILKITTFRFPCLIVL